MRASVLFGLVLVGLSTGSRAEDWYRWRGPYLDGIARETNWTTEWPKEGPPRLWQAEVGTGFATVSIRDGRLFTVGHSNEHDTVWCLDALTGQRRWSYSYPAPLDAQYYEGGPGATPTIDGEVVYTLSNRGRLHCFETAAGRVVWQRHLTEELGLKKPRWGFAAAPLVQGERLFLNAGTSGLALDKKNGHPVWVSGSDAAGYASPVPFTIQSQPALLIFGAKALYAVHSADGRVAWSWPWQTKWDINIPQPIVSDSRIFISSFDRGGALLDSRATPPQLVWTNKAMRNHFSSCVGWHGHLYGVDGNTDQPGIELRCVEFNSGTVTWRYGGLGLASVLLAAGKLIVLSDKGELVLAEASPEKFRPLARTQVLGGKCWTPPVLSNGLLYCRNASGKLVCLDLRMR